jgi:hypothetical protein
MPEAGHLRKLRSSGAFRQPTHFWMITAKQALKACFLAEFLNMSKTLETMNVEELSQYMKEHQDNPVEWQKAYDLFAQKSDWQEIPENATREEEKQFIADFISQVVN